MIDYIITNDLAAEPIKQDQIIIDRGGKLAFDISDAERVVILEDIGNELLLKQNITDNVLNTTNKTIVGAINELLTTINSITTFEVQVVSTLPTTGSDGVIYLVSRTGEDNDIHDEYVWVSSLSDYELIGSTQLDLSGYYTSTEVDTLLAKKADILVNLGVDATNTWKLSPLLASAYEPGNYTFVDSSSARISIMTFGNVDKPGVVGGERAGIQILSNSAEPNILYYRHLSQNAVGTVIPNTWYYAPDMNSVSDAIDEVIEQLPAYITCTTAAATAAKESADITSLVLKGQILGVKFTHANTATNPTLKIGTGAAYPFHSALTSDYVAEEEMADGMVALVQFTGSHWILLNPMDISKAKVSHTHDLTDITGLGSLAGDLSDISEALSGKADAVHTHDQSDITNLEDDLTTIHLLIENKADASHTHAQSDITDLEDDLDALSAAIDGKAPTGHASAANTYGLGTMSLYGHVKLSTDGPAAAVGTSGSRVGALRYEAQMDAVTPNFNDYRTPGEWYFNAATATNAPSFTSGASGGYTLKVIQQYSNTHCTQMCWRRESSEIWIRYSTSATAWSAWEKIAQPGKRFTFTIPVSGWSANAPFTINIPVTGVTDGPTTVIDLLQDNDVTTAKAQLESWARVSRVTTYDGGVTVYCYDKIPTTPIPVQLKELA